MATVDEPVHGYIKLYTKYRKGIVRLDSFATCTDTSTQLHRLWAKAGFYHFGKRDTVRCYACYGEIDGWKDCCYPEPLHAQRYPDCPLVLGLDVDDVPVGPGADLRFERALYPQFVQESARVCSFERWRWRPRPDCPHVQPALLAKAGFFYGGTADDCTCFYCGGTVLDWQPTDEPWSEHATHFPTCIWLVEQRGSHFVEHVQSLGEEQPVQSLGEEEQPVQSLAWSDPPDVPPLRATDDPVPSDDDTTSSVESHGLDEAAGTSGLDALLEEVAGLSIGSGPECTSAGDTKECAVCMDNTANVVFFPCKHLVTCVECAHKVNEICICCRQPIRYFIKVYTT